MVAPATAVTRPSWPQMLTEQCGKEKPRLNKVQTKQKDPVMNILDKLKGVEGAGKAASGFPGAPSQEGLVEGRRTHPP